MAVTLAVIHGLVLFGFFIAVAGAWFSRYLEIGDCSMFAAVVVGVLALATVPVVVMSGTSVLLLMFALIVGLARNFLFTAVGAAYCARGGFAAFPLLRPGLGGLDDGTARLAVGPTMIAALVVSGAWAAYTVVLFRVFTPELSEAAERLIGEAGEADGVAIGMIAVSLVALEEELVYRLGIQNFIAGAFGWWDRRYWLAILISATIWTIGHVGTLEPGWVKLVQIFPAGIALGWLARKHGIEACIVAHVVFNLAAFSMSETGLVPL